MGQITFADLISRPVPLAASEAAALTLAVARLMDARRMAGQRVRLPDDEWILLSSGGEVSIVEVHGSTEADETARLSALLRRLLRLDDRLPSGGHGTIPGGLLIVLARNLGYIHLPATSPEAFRAALERFAAANPAVLAAVFWRAAASRPARLPRDLVPRRAVEARIRSERRRRGPSCGDLRRALRELERELFELRARASGNGAHLHRPGRVTVRHAMAAALAACLIGVVAVASLAVTADAPERTAGLQDVELTPSPRVVPAAQTVVPPAPRAAAANRGRPITQVSRVDIRRASASSSPSVTRAATRTKDTNTRRTRPKADPMAALRGGTRGIPFMQPPG